MKNNINHNPSYYSIIYAIFIFVAAVIVLYLTIPNEIRFKYEFQKNAPWRHETLIAPFDFAIQKAEKDIKSEKDSVRKDFIPYFTEDSLVKKQQIKGLQDKILQISENKNIISDSIKNSIISCLSNLYDLGIVEQSPDVYPLLKDKKEIFLIKGKIVSSQSVYKLHSLKTAYQFLSDTMKIILGNNNSFISKISLIDYIQANLTYDETFNKQELDKINDSVSLTKGMVQSGERIIFKGDIVTPEKFLILNSLKQNYQDKAGKNFNHYLVITGKLFFIICCLLSLFFYLNIYRKDVIRNLKHLSFILLMQILMVFISRFIILHDSINIYVLPLALMPIFIRIFFDSRTAIFTTFVSCLLIGYFAPNNYEFIFQNFIAGVVAVFSLHKMNSRSHLVFTVFWVFLSYVVTFFALSLIKEGNINTIHWTDLQWYVANAILLLLVYPLLYIFEKLFTFVSDITLIELSNTNLPLLRKLSEEAPGTFQHSLQVASLAEEVIHRIGGNPFLSYAGGLYHDIGKMYKPDFFVENQSSIINTHNDTDYRKSAQIIIDHVTQGVKMAKKNKLPDALIEFIRTHHGTSHVKYFYTLLKNENPEEAAKYSNDFSYPGPLPRSKETSVVMMIDGIEAAARSLKEKTPESLKGLIDNMIQQKLEEGQLNNADLTLRDIQITKETLTEKFTNIYHVRMEYPKEKESIS